jgi:hypothetical protein
MIVIGVVVLRREAMLLLLAQVVILWVLHIVLIGVEETGLAEVVGTQGLAEEALAL